MKEILRNTTGLSAIENINLIKIIIRVFFSKIAIAHMTLLRSKTNSNKNFKYS